MSFPSPTKQQARVLWFALTAVSIAVVLVLIGLLFWGLGWVLHRLSAVLVPMAFALILAYILNPVVEYFGRKGMKRVWAVCLVFALAGVFSLALIGSVLPDLKSEVSKLISELPNNMEVARANVQRFVQESTVAQQLPENWRRGLVGPLAPRSTNAHPAAPQSTTNTKTNTPALQLNLNFNMAGATNQASAQATNAAPDSVTADDIKSMVDAPLTDTVVPALSHTLMFVVRWFTAQLSKVTTWVEFLIGFILVPVYLFYFLLEKEEITRRWTDYLPVKESAAKQEIVFVLKSINDCMIVFFRGQVLVALCVGVLLATGYLIMGLNYAVLLGVVACVLGVVPYLGTIVSLILALSVAGIQFGDWTHPLIVLGIAATVKLLEDFIISPRIIGERSGLHPLTIILAVMIGTTLLGGFIGALLAIPLTATLRTLMFRYVWNPSDSPPVPETEETGEMKDG